MSDSEVTADVHNTAKYGNGCRSALAISETKVFRDFLTNGILLETTATNKGNRCEILSVSIHKEEKKLTDKSALIPPHADRRIRITSDEIDVGTMDELRMSPRFSIDVKIRDGYMNPLLDSTVSFKDAKKSPGDSKSRTITMESDISRKHITSRIQLDDMVDPFEASEGRTKIGSVHLTNNEDEDESCTIHIELNSTVMTFNKTLRHGTEEEQPLIIPSHLLHKETTSLIPFRITVLDWNMNVICDLDDNIRVRSIYDVDTSKWIERIPRIVNPESEMITDIVRRSDGPLLNGEGLGEVTGYQDKNKILPQMRAVFSMVQNLGLCYVSSTSAPSTGDGHMFQHVRNPDAVLRDGSGNCVELSVLFASIFEAMDLDPVILVLNSHAIPGVVIDTDMYNTSFEDCSIKCENSLTVRNGEKSFTAIFLESTLCTTDADFDTAVKVANKSIRRELNSIEMEKRYSLIRQERYRGVTPEVFACQGQN